jgi:SAM-dependent methyltransferase
MDNTSPHQTEGDPARAMARMPTTTLGATACPSCAGPELSATAFDERRILLGRCGECGLRWVLDPPTGDEFAALYTSGFYEPAPARGGRLVGRLHRLNNAIRIRELRGITPGRLLDVGCGKGRFLAAARDAGWEVLGVEFAPASAEAARAAYGIEVAIGDFVELPLEGSFDAVTMWHVLEHLPDPFAAVARAAELLRPGGRLVVSVPNIESLQARLGGERWFHLDLPRHLMHFTPRSLSALVARTGMRVERIGHLYPEMEVIGLVQTILNRVGIENDLLYRFAKRDPSAESGPSVYASFALALAAAPAAVAWSMVAPILGTGASIQLVAHRR